MRWIDRLRSEESACSYKKYEGANRERNTRKIGWIWRIYKAENTDIWYGWNINKLIYYILIGLGKFDQRFWIHTW
jgi:hypothetical protein